MLSKVYTLLRCYSSTKRERTKTHAIRIKIGDRRSASQLCEAGSIVSTTRVIGEPRELEMIEILEEGTRENVGREREFFPHEHRLFCFLDYLND